MRAIDCITQFLSNLQHEGLHTGSVHVLLCLAGGMHTCGEMIMATGMTPKAVSTILSKLVKEGYLVRLGRGKPYCYLVTAEGRKLVKRLMTPRPSEGNPAGGREGNARN